MPGLISDRRLYLTADKDRVVEDGDTAAAYLLAPEGTEISADDCARLGLSRVDGKVMQYTAEVAAQAPAKEVAPAPPENPPPTAGKPAMTSPAKTPRDKK